MLRRRTTLPFVAFSSMPGGKQNGPKVLVLQVSSWFVETCFVKPWSKLLQGDDGGLCASGGG